ncbi:MAG: efflux RND transporter periplasmic adaptor subunit [Myxococcaceae bacterium]|nr:efflux RND transporter periplasmic adaptor subunit [Myxococcaceae bacterium]
MASVWMAALAAGASGCAGKAADKPAPPPREVEVARLTPSEVRETGEYLGTLVSRQSVTVLPQVAGYVRRIHVRPGQHVEAGDALLEVDARQESAALESAQANRTSAEASLELARQTRARSETMHKEGLLSAQELERAVAQAEAAEAAERAAAAQVAQRQVQLQFHVVRAPFAGTTGDVLVRVGDAVGATTPLTSVAQADALEVSVAVPAERARTLAQGAPLEVLDGKGDVVLTSPVFFIAPQADPRTQLVEVKAAFRNTAGLRPSELMRARLVYSTRQALQLPAAAVVRQSGQAFAFVVQQKDGQARVERRPVTLGALGEAAYVVEQGLEAGDVVATSSLHLLRDGAPVRPRPAAGAGASAGQAPSDGARATTGQAPNVGAGATTGQASSGRTAISGGSR